MDFLFVCLFQNMAWKEAEELLLKIERLLLMTNENQIKVSDTLNLRHKRKRQSFVEKK